jgi:hypothetical protein
MTERFAQPVGAHCDLPEDRSSVAWRGTSGAALPFCPARQAPPHRASTMNVTPHVIDDDTQATAK